MKIIENLGSTGSTPEIERLTPLVKLTANDGDNYWFDVEGETFGIRQDATGIMDFDGRPATESFLNENWELVAVLEAAARALSSKPSDFTVGALMKRFRAQFLENTGEVLDFRKHVYLENQYGCSPVFGYEMAETIIDEIYTFAQDFVDGNQEHFPGFGGWEYNKQMACETLRHTPASHLVNEILSALHNHYQA